MIKFLAWFIAIGYSLIILIYLIRLLNFSKEYKKSKELKFPKEFNKDMVFVIPMFKEEKMAKETFDFFVDIAKKYPKTKIVFVTTAKEDSNNKPTTFDILNSCVNDENRDFVRLYNYPKKTGVMAHQVNYGVKKYFEEFNNLDCWIGIYNCDSRLSDDSLNEIYYNVNKSKNTNVFQQYSYYYVEGKKGESVPLSSAVWQTRWSIFKENALARNKNKILDKNIKNKKFQALVEPFVYCVGHGCVANIKTFIDCGGMPEDTINEDTFMGYVFNCENIRIIPLYMLEKAQSVSSTKQLIRQQTSWFNGPVASFSYYKYYNKGTDGLFKRPICKKEDKFRAKILALKSFNYAIHWLISPILLLILMPLFWGLSYGIWGVLISFLIAEFYLFGVNLIMFLYLKKQNIKIPHPSLIFDIIFYFCHGLSALIWIFKSLFKKNNMSNKYKTER